MVGLLITRLRKVWFIAESVSEKNLKSVKIGKLQVRTWLSRAFSSCYQIFTDFKNVFTLTDLAINRLFSHVNVSQASVVTYARSCGIYSKPFYCRFTRAGFKAARAPGLTPIECLPPNRSYFISR